jgi:hypothetical protein
VDYVTRKPKTFMSANLIEEFPHLGIVLGSPQNPMAMENDIFIRKLELSTYIQLRCNLQSNAK